MTSRVLIAGGGVGGLETALALRAHAPDGLAVTLMAAEPHFVYRPLSVGVPFGGASTVRVDLAEIAAERGFAFVEDAVTAVDLDGHVVTARRGGRFPYDQLVLALGARQVEAIPGALTFHGPKDVDRFRGLLTRLEDADGGRVVFAARSATDWTLPLYELALMTAAWAAHQELAVRVALVTAERAPLEVFGEAVSAELGELLAANRIETYFGAVPEAVVDGGLWIPMEGRLDADVVVALPALTGRDVPGLPRDRLGFVPVDAFCRVRGAADAYAIGDMTDRPVRQGGLAAQQGDVAAACIAAAAGAPVQPQPYEPVLRALLFTGTQPRYLRHPPVPHQEGPASDSGAVPWWPPHKIVGAHLAPYLATHAELLEPLPHS